jgi:hypothetical protein
MVDVVGKYIASPATLTNNQQQALRINAKGAVVFQQEDSDGNPMGGASYSLASNATITATSGTTPVTGIAKGNYVWNAVFTGTSVKLQSLGADGATWFDVATLSASGTFAGEIRFGANSQVRLYNPNGTSDTGVYSSIS